VAALLKLGVSKKVAAVLILISLTALSIVVVNYVTVQAAVDSANDGDTELSELASPSPSPSPSPSSSPSPSPSHDPEPCLTTTMVAFAVSAAVVVAGLLLYFRKREH
jgi:hypothetical protein